jgi:hypothetical protein
VWEPIAGLSPVPAADFESCCTNVAIFHASLAGSFGPKAGMPFGRPWRIDWTMFSGSPP